MTPDRSDADSTVPSRGVEPAGESVAGWPVPLTGVTETIVATRTPDGRWNQAALGVHGPDASSGKSGSSSERTVTARTWGQTRTRRAFERSGSGYVQCTRDPIDFVAAALSVHETDEPILDRSGAWARVEATEVGRTDDDGTEVVEWRLDPTAAAVRERIVPSLDRGRAAVVEATVAASRIGVDGYDPDELRERLGWLASVVDRCGSERDAVAFERIDELTSWRD